MTYSFNPEICIEYMSLWDQPEEPAKLVNQFVVATFYDVICTLDLLLC